jgi:hypothetical protein
MELRTETKTALRNILDTMTGTDGGSRFMKLRWFLEAMDKKATNGDPSAEEVISVMKRFSRMIDIAQDL